MQLIFLILLKNPLSPTKAVTFLRIIYFKFDLSENDFIVFTIPSSAFTGIFSIPNAAPIP